MKKKNKLRKNTSKEKILPDKNNLPFIQTTPQEQTNQHIEAYKGIQNTADYDTNNHPLMVKARQSLTAGNLKETVQSLLDLSMISTPLECAQILCKVSDLIKHINFNQALKFAIDATKVESFYSFTWFHLSKIYHYKRMIKDARDAGLKALKAKASPIELVDIGRHLSILGGVDQESLEAVKKGYRISNNSINLASYTLRVALQNADWELSEKIITQLSQVLEYHLFTFLP